MKRQGCTRNCPLPTAHCPLQDRIPPVMKRLLVGVTGLVLAGLATVLGQAPRPAESFDAVYGRLKQGATYQSQPAGVSQMPTTLNGVLLDNTLIVPDGYRPDRKYPLRVQLHGGVGRPAPRAGQQPQQGGRGALTANRIPSDEPTLVLQPRAYADIEWWRGNQVDNILNLVDAVKRKYNVDENRVYLTGISDGGTGVYFFAMRQTTAFAACMPLNGHPLVLANPSVGADQQLYATNAVNCPMYAVNGGMDPLYPADSVTPFIRMYRNAGATVEYHIHPEAGHNTNWWPEERPLYERWLAAHPRTPHPASLTWETDRPDRYNRVSWLKIDGLAKRTSDVSLLDLNSIETGNGGRQPVFLRQRPSGRVDITREGNTFAARTRGVQQFTLLLSPDVVDFSKPVIVTVNGREVFSGAVKKDVATLMKWAARDNDRTMLYGAELPIIVP